MKIAVLIPALNEASRIASAVASALRSPDPDIEVIVIDGGSTDATRDVAEAAGARVVSSPPGRARQQAAGLSVTRADVLLFLHGDSELPSRWSDWVRAALADPGASGGAFSFAFREPSPGLRWIEWGVRLRLLLFRMPYGDQGIFVRRDVIEAMGGVPQVPIMEDLDLVRGIKAAGRLVICPKAVLTSPRRYTRFGPFRTVLRNARALLAWRLGLDRERVARWYHA